MGDVKLTSPRVRVIRDGQEVLELQTDNRDLLLWDTTRIKHKWPKLDEAPFLWLTFIAWAAARRTGAIVTDHTYEKWRDEVLEVAALDAEDDEAGSPSEPGLEPG